MTNVERAEAYYTLMGKKNAEGVSGYLSPDVVFSSPFATLQGKEATLKAIGNFMNAFQSLTIRAKFGTEEQAMIVYDVDMPGIGNAPGASLMDFRDGLIVNIELFYDGSRFLEKKEEIFS